MKMHRNVEEAAHLLFAAFQCVCPRCPTPPDLPLFIMGFNHPLGNTALSLA
jgi:hypothetical protein